VAALAVALLAACGTRGANPTSDARVVAVVAAENFWGDVAAQVGGVHARVKSLINDPTADPHLYDSDARGAAAIADASVVVENGLGYDDFVGDLLSSTSGGKHVVNAAKAMGYEGDNANPHVWYAIERVPSVARAIAHAHGIDSAYAGAPVAYTERVPEYVVQEAGLANRTPESFASAIEDGNEPSARDTKAMNDLVRSHAIKVLLYDAQATSPVTDAVRDLAHRSDVAVVGVTETMPKRAASYQAWMLDQLHALRVALAS
jgi:zinc/manganese transport system substrate-binding protein